MGRAAHVLVTADGSAYAIVIDDQAGSASAEAFLVTTLVPAP
jgi:hypothetical protein